MNVEDKAVEEIKKSYLKRTPMSLRVLPMRPSAWAAVSIGAAQALPQTWWWGKLIVLACVAFILFWQSRVRRASRETNVR